MNETEFSNIHKKSQCEYQHWRIGLVQLRSQIIFLKWASGLSQIAFCAAQPDRSMLYHRCLYSSQAVAF